MAKFMLTGALKGKTVILGMNQYSFVEGVLECSDEDADKIQDRLVTYYGAKRMAEKGQPTEADAKKAAEEAAAAEAAAKAAAAEAAKKPAGGAQ
jgi:hypothetical protein